MSIYKLFNYFNHDSWIWLVLIIAARIYGVFLIGVLFNNKWMPKILKISLSVSFALIVCPYINDYSHSLNVMFVLVLMIKEFIFGAILSYLLNFPFWVIQNVGNIIDMQRGEQFGSIINQTTNNPSSSIGDLLLQGYIGYFMQINGMLFYLNMIFSSFKIMGIFEFTPRGPLSSLKFYQSFFGSYIHWLGILVIPVIVCTFMLDIVLGIIGSFVPSLNITIMAMPIKSIIALFLLLFYIGVIYHVGTIQFFSPLRQVIMHY